MYFRNLSIRKKLTALMMVISALILLLVSGLYMVEEVYTTRTYLEREMRTLGTALGNSVKQLLMQQEIKTTEEILTSLSGQPNIRSAYLFDESGTPVAEYLDPTATNFILDVISHDFDSQKGPYWRQLDRGQVSYSWQHVGLFLPIKHDRRQVGSIYLMSDLRDLYGHLYGVFFFVLLALGILMLFSWWLAGRLQRPVSAPVLSLAETIHDISQSKNFTLRATKHGGDEIGLLVDGFNRMLEQIEVHRKELVDHQKSLEMTIFKRTEELRQMVSVLELAKQQAEAASVAKSQFLANITHELRTPLIGVLGMNELMLRTAMDEQQQMLATTVQNSGTDLLTLINNVLDFSKIESGKMQLEIAEFSLYRVVEEALGLLAGSAEKKNLALYSDIPRTATCRVLGDEVRLRQIVMNLVGNAVKFTEQGSVKVSLTCELNNSDAEFSLEVKDTGVGMNAESQREIFSAFYQADVSHTRKFGGTGLGLAIVQQLVKLLNGRLELESSVGAGSCFRLHFSLPLAETSRLGLPDAMRQKAILICCDDHHTGSFLCSRLMELGLRPTLAVHPQNAWFELIQAARSGEPFNLLMVAGETYLPDGKLFSAAVAETAELNNLRTVLLLKRTRTVNSMPQELKKLYLPVSWDSLLEVLQQSWNELKLVSSSTQICQADKPEATDGLSDSRCRILLIGGTLASQELLKLSLLTAPIEITALKRLTELDSVDFAQYAAVLFDAETATPEELLQVCRGICKKAPLFLLCSAAVDTSQVAELISGQLARPLQLHSFVQQLLPCLSQGEPKETLASFAEGAQ